MSIRRKGFSHERELVKKLWDSGFAVVRAPASGSKAKRIMYPDIVAIYRGKIIAIEAKTISEPRTIYIEEQQIKKLVEFAKRAGCESYIAVKVVGSGELFFISLSKLEKTNNKYKLSKESLNEGIRLESLVSMVKGVKGLAEFM